jgi:hypothetical protein
MEKEFVPYELALKMKELGFDEPCFGYYVDGEIRGVNLGIEELGGVEPYYQRFGFHTLSNHDIFNSNKIVVTAPTFSQAFSFFREKYGLHSFIDCKWKNLGWEYELVDLNKMESISTIGNYGYNTPEESELECLKKLIQIVENGKTL